MHYLEKHSNKEDHPLQLLRESQRKSFCLQGLIAKRGTFNDVRSISFTDPDLQRIVEHQKRLINLDMLKPYNKPKTIQQSERSVYPRLTSKGINNLGSAFGGSVFGKQNGAKNEAKEEHKKSITLDDIGASPALSKRNTEIHSSPAEIPSKRVKHSEKRDSHPVSVFRNINL